jgi:cytochrome P450
MLTPEFTFRRISELRPGIQRSVNELIAELRGAEGAVDLVDRFSVPLPALMICQLLGVPAADQPFFQTHVRTISTSSENSAAVGAAYSALGKYLDELVAAKERTPTPDLLGRVAERYVATGELTHDELVAMARLLLIAGNDATANMIAMAVLTLMSYPDQLARLHADPDLIESAADELLRFLSVSQSGMVRVATADIEIGGRLVAKDDGVLFSLLAANHDESAFPDGGRLDITRETRGHVAFGYGLHQCLGKSLARIELQVAVGTLLREFPAIRLAVPREQLNFRFDSFVYGVEHLPVLLTQR